jgi:hypothetical protein
MKFQIGQSSLEVCKIIVNNHKDIARITLIAHEVEVNWRQVHKKKKDKLKNMLFSFEHPRIIMHKEYSRDEFIQLNFNDLPFLRKNQVWSINSKVQTYDGKTKHIPMMNFHPEIGSKNDIKKAIKYICKKRRGVLLNSGRFQHYYGDFILDESEWIKFMAEFLMPTILVSPRYIGHRLYNDYCSLRLTSNRNYKPKIPEVIEIL